MGGGRSGDVGQPPDDASRPPVTARESARCPPHDNRRRRADGGASGGGLAPDARESLENLIDAVRNYHGNSSAMRSHGRSF